jgi:hypothetical protein
MHPLFLMTALYLWLYQAPEFASINGPPRSIALALSDFENEDCALAVESVNVNPN